MATTPLSLSDAQRQVAMRMLGTPGLTSGTSSGVTVTVNLSGLQRLCGVFVYANGADGVVTVFGCPVTVRNGNNWSIAPVGDGLAASVVIGANLDWSVEYTTIGQ